MFKNDLAATSIISFINGYDTNFMTVKGKGFVHGYRFYHE